MLDLLLIHLLIGAFIGLWALWDFGGANNDDADPLLQVCAAVAIFLMTTVIWPAIVFVMFRREVRRWFGSA